MDKPTKTVSSGYTNAFGRHIDDDIENWFRYGIKPVVPETDRSICSKRTTLYVVLSGVCFIVLCAIIIVPVVLGMSNQKTG